MKLRYLHNIYWAWARKSICGLPYSMIRIMRVVEDSFSLNLWWEDFLLTELFSQLLFGHVVTHVCLTSGYLSQSERPILCVSSGLLALLDNHLVFRALSHHQHTRLVLLSCGPTFLKSPWNYGCIRVGLEWVWPKSLSNPFKV